MTIYILWQQLNFAELAWHILRALTYMLWELLPGPVMFAGWTSRRLVAASLMVIKILKLVLHSAEPTLCLFQAIHLMLINILLWVADSTPSALCWLITISLMII